MGYIKAILSILFTAAGAALAVFFGLILLTSFMEKDALIIVGIVVAVFLIAAIITLVVSHRKKLEQKQLEKLMWEIVLYISIPVLVVGFVFYFLVL